MTEKNDKNFAWEEGEELNDKDYNPLGNVRAKGAPKLKKAIHADPSKRKQERDEDIKRAQAESYKPKIKEEIEADDSLIIEESHSGITGEYEDSQAKKLIDPGSKIKGLDRFGKKKK